MATIRQRNGKYHVQVRRRGHPTITKTFIIKQDAQQWARQMEVQIDRLELPANPKELSCIFASHPTDTQSLCTYAVNPEGGRAGVSD